MKFNRINTGDIMKETITVEMMNIRVTSSEDGRYIYVQNHKDGWIDSGAMDEKVMIPVEMVDPLCKLLKKHQKEHKASKV
jgi:hypothetical protein